MARDGSSGGVIRMVTIDKSGVAREFIPGRDGGREGGRVCVWVRGERERERRITIIDTTFRSLCRCVSQATSYLTDPRRGAVCG